MKYIQQGLCAGNALAKDFCSYTGQAILLAFITLLLPPHLHNSLTSSMYLKYMHSFAFEMKVTVHLLTVFTVQFNRAGWKLNRSSSFAGLRKPEVLNLAVSAQHVHVQNWAERKTGRHGLLDDSLVFFWFLHSHAKHAFPNPLNTPG